ncbi:MAG: LytR C-terminal domain-containing protein [Actinobacteria bacterium]|nr:LytR C-terminal domain-containing protein [Actinomycetota bacterium]
MRIRLPFASVLATAFSLGVATSACSSGGESDPTTTVTTSTLAPATTSSSTSTTSTTSTTTTSTTTTLPPTTTTEAIVTAGGVVLVANGSGVPGAGARLTAQFTERGFTVAEPVNAAGSQEQVELTYVYAKDVNDPVARAVSRLLGSVPILRMPSPLPAGGGLPGDATVVVMLGKDTADNALLDL